MSKLKFSSNLFLEKQELDRFKLFLDDDGFRAFLLDNSVSFGFVKKYNEVFVNALVIANGNSAVDIAEASLIDSNGNVILSPAITALAIPTDNNWYWIKIIHNFSTEEVGTYSVDSSGNLVCTSANGNLLSILRGQPNYPSRIKFTNATNNVLEYDIEEVIDDNNAVLTGIFTAESSLTISVIGTFTNGYVALDSEKNIFQYDSSIITLIQSNTTSEPSHTSGIEFFLARVRTNGTVLSIEDKRNDIWTTNANYYLRNIDRLGNPLLGIEQITFDDQFTPRDKNIIQVGWNFRATSFTVNPKVNKITIATGQGGRYKTVANFTDGDFDSWRVYSADGQYYKIQTSALVGGSIELVLDSLEATSFFSDINSTTPISQTLVLTPEAEEIEIICTPNPASTNDISIVRKTFPINELYGRVFLTVYASSGVTYNVKYRYKHILDYGPLLTPLSDAIGYYAESQFDINGVLIGSTRIPYIASSSSGFIPLVLNTKAYFNFQAKVDIGDIRGVETVQLSNTMIPVRNLIVGSNKQYQYYDGSLLTLTNDLSINLKSIDVDSIALRDGNSFILHFKSAIDLNGNNLKIVYNYDTIPVVLKTFNQNDIDLINSSNHIGLFILCVFDKSNSRWIISDTNNKQKQVFKVTATGISVSATPMTNLAGLTITTPDDGITRKYMMTFKGAITPSSASATSGCNLQFYNNSDSVAYDFTAVGKSSNTDDVNVVGVGLLDYQSVGPNKTITIQGDKGGSVNAPTLNYAVMMLIEID